MDTRSYEPSSAGWARKALLRAAPTVHSIRSQYVAEVSLRELAECPKLLLKLRLPLPHIGE